MSASDSRQSGEERFGAGLARAFGGAILFAYPMIMTMEMWWLGFYMEPLRLALLLLLTVPLLMGLSHYSGFEATSGWVDDVVDAFVALAVGFVASAAMLWLLAILGPRMTADEIVGKITLQAIPASIGAMLARSQLGSSSTEKERKQEAAGYTGEIFFMVVGALFLAFNVAPTEEMVLIAMKMTEWHGVVLAAASVLVMHAFVYGLNFRGEHSAPPGTPLWSVFLRFTVLGYAIALLLSAYILWTFGRTDGLSAQGFFMDVVVLGFPAAIGAAVARLIL